MGKNKPFDDKKDKTASSKKGRLLKFKKCMDIN